MGAQPVEPALARVPGPDRTVIARNWCMLIASSLDAVAVCSVLMGDDSLALVARLSATLLVVSGCTPAPRQ